MPHSIRLFLDRMQFDETDGLLFEAQIDDLKTYRIQIAAHILPEYFEKPIEWMPYDQCYVAMKYTIYLQELINWMLDNDVNVFPGNVIVISQVVIDESSSVRGMTPLFA